MIDDTTTDLGEINARAAVVAISVTGLSPAELGAARVIALEIRSRVALYWQRSRCRRATQEQ